MEIKRSIKSEIQEHLGKKEITLITGVRQPNLPIIPISLLNAEFQLKHLRNICGMLKRPSAFKF